MYCLNEMDNFGMFRTQLRKVFEVLRYRTDKEEMLRIIREGNGYQNLDEETLEMLAVLMNEPRIWEQRKEYEQKEECGGGYNMCKALDDMKKEAKMEGREEGREEGAIEVLCSLVKDGMIKMEDAAKRLNMTEELFRVKMMGIR